MASEKKDNLYSILELSSSASIKEIRSQYKKLAMKYHPDKNPEGTAKFQDLNRAHEILSDPDKKKIYDTFGEIALQGDAFYPKPDPQTLEFKWGKTIAFLVITFVIQYFFQIAIESIIAIFFGIYTHYQLSVKDKYFILFYVGVDIILYFIFSYSVLWKLSLIFVYTSLFIWNNAIEKNWDLTCFSVIAIVSSKIYFFDVPSTWHLLNAQSCTFCFIYILGMVVKFRTSIISEKSYILSIVGPYFTLIPNLLIPLWLVIWTIDYFIGINIEWILGTLIWAKMVINSTFCLNMIYLIIGLFSYYFIPSSWILFLCSTSIHVFVLIMVYLTVLQAEEEESKAKLGETFDENEAIKFSFLRDWKNAPRCYYSAFFILEYLDLFYRDSWNPKRFLPFAICTWMLILISIIRSTLEELILYAKESEEKELQTKKKKKKKQSFGKTELTEMLKTTKKKGTNKKTKRETSEKSKTEQNTEEVLEKIEILQMTTKETSKEEET